ncbi:zinc finger CCCH domain-containing protein 13 isoform X1 [Cydia fagiglandana]|uniref:zinc finger CCCH domain-containing protein 13 isoform X1 n=1 Tax=Cydia fagiglandana TaxID=1458189 RepID=UPI002FEE49D5
MTDETGATDKPEDGDNVKTENETKEPKRTVSFNRDVHVKRFGKPRERGTSKEPPPTVRKEPFTHLSEQELIDEANRVRAQADSVTCTSDNPEKFFSLPHRRKKEDRTSRRNSDDNSDKTKSPLERSVSDVGSKKKKERTSISTLFRRAKEQRNKPDVSVVVTAKPAVIVKRSKSDVSDLKSKDTNLNTQPKPIRKRSGSESEEFLKSLRNRKSQLSPIIESSPREDYFKKTPPLEVFQKQKLAQKDSTKSEELSPSESSKVNPIEKPPRFKTPEKKEPKPPARTKKGKSSGDEKEKSPPIKETPKRKTEVKKTLLVDEIDSIKAKDINPVELKDRIKESIRKIEENVYAGRDMIHSSQQPPDKPPLTRGNTVDHMVKLLKEDQHSPPPKTHLISPPNGTNINQPFSYTKPSVSPDPNLFARNTSPDRVPSPVNKMMNRGVVYAHVVRDLGDTKSNNVTKQTVHKTFTPPRDRYGQHSDEDEGLGYEERYKYSNNRLYDSEYKNNTTHKNSETYKIIDSPIRPRFREYKLTSFDDIEPTYANEYPLKEDKSRDFIESSRGQADGMDTKRKPFESEDKVDLDFNELSHRRQLLESRLNARRYDRDRINTGEPITKYLVETDPIYEAEKRRLATEKYVNETAKYYRHTVERDGFAESSITEDYNKYDSDNHKLKYNTESRTFHKVSKNELDRREFIDKLEPMNKIPEKRNGFPPEPEYEPPSLEINVGKPVLTPDEYKEQKYRIKKQLTSSHDVLQSGHKYRKDEGFGKRKGHYASNPEIAQEREEEYANIRNDAKHAESYHNSLRRMKNKDKYYKEDYSIRRHDSGDSRDYYREETPRRYEVDNRLVDSGIENDFRKDSCGEIHRSRKHGSIDDVRNTSLFLASERQHTEDNYPSEQIYANGEYMARFEDYRPDGYRKDGYVPRERSADDGSHFEPRGERYDKSISREDKISAKPPKVTKKLSGLEKMKQLFSRDSSKKSKKEKEVQPKPRTRVLKSPEHLAGDDSDYKRYTDPEPSDIEVRKKDYEPKEERRYDKDDRRYEKEGRYRGSRENLDRYRPSEQRDSDPERKYKETELERSRYERTMKEERKYQERREARRYNSSDRESELRPSDDDRRRTKSRTAPPHDSPALAQRYRERRRLATPSPTPSPPRTQGWFKSLDRLSRKKKNVKTEKEIPPEDRSSKPKLNSPAKNLRFFGDTDVESDAKHSTVKPHGTLRKTVSNSTSGLDEVDHAELNKSYSLSNLDKSDKKYYKRNLHNISEIQSEDSQRGLKPPMSPYDRSRSHSSSKTLRNGRRERGSSSELRSSKQDLNRDYKYRRRTPAHSGESSTEGDSSHQSQRSVVYLHATTVGDIPDPGRVTRNRSRDDVSSVNSSNLQVRSTTKSFSLFAPWTPRHPTDHHDLHYAQRPKKTSDRPPTLQKNKSYSQSTLTRRPVNNRLTSSSTTLHRKPERKERRDGQRSQSSEVLNRDRVSRSISMPKDEKKAGWFKLSNKKKPETTRVR